MKKRKKIQNFLLFCLLLNPLSVSKVKAIEKDRQVEKHLRNLFPKIKILEEYKLEAKEIATEIITHGASN